ncbi:serine threonine-protein kinase [Musa troglodytarum]|uniref:Serine threonine-protein kinase n=1 Tax=Musa troglodytarum TaxID=320322 RepID=A0A9E7FQ65_9LILI|nr:serine threonine-protein kinase [Musa troglodytarum]
MDSHLEGNFSSEEATTPVDLASQCLHCEPRDRPNSKKLVARLRPLQTKLEREEAPPAPHQPLSPMGEACSRMDLIAIHQILVMTYYRVDEVTNEGYARKRGDFAFRDKDFKTAIQLHCVTRPYFRIPDRIPYLDRGLTAFYMQAVALAKPNMQNDSLDVLQEAAALEEKRQKSGSSCVLGNDSQTDTNYHLLRRNRYRGFHKI